MGKERYNKSKDYIRAYKDEMVRDLKYFAATPSVRSDSINENEPFGHECSVCKNNAELFLSLVLKQHLTRKAAAKQKQRVFFTHTGVVLVNEADWLLAKPFESIKRDGFLIGC